jgi:hypothetical protein
MICPLRAPSRSALPLRRYRARTVTALLVGLSALQIGCQSTQVWSGFVHEEGDNPDPAKAHTMGDFHSLEACRAACLSLIRERHCPGQGCWPRPDYECGFECQPNAYGLNHCERREH